MNPSVALNPLIQGMAAVVIFITGYLLLLFSILFCVLLIALMAGAIRSLWRDFQGHWARTGRGGTRRAEAQGGGVPVRWQAGARASRNPVHSH